eukprot:12410830-Karenia_brevis.AAC.1
MSGPHNCSSRHPSSSISCTSLRADPVLIMPMSPPEQNLPDAKIKCFAEVEEEDKGAQARHLT